MLHNFGSVLIALQMPKIFRRAAVLAEATDRPKFLVERELIGMDHFEIGGLVAEKWKLEAVISEAIRFHRDIQDEVERTQLMDVLWLASKIMGEIQPKSRHVEEAHPSLGATLSFTLDELREEIESVKVAVDRVQVFREV